MDKTKKLSQPLFFVKLRNFPHTHGPTAKIGRLEKLLRFPSFVSFCQRLSGKLVFSPNVLARLFFES